MSLRATGPTITLRFAEPSDAPGLFAHARDPEVTRFFSWGPYARVEEAEAYVARLPAERAARVTLTLDDGETLAAEVANPVGDADHHPFGHAEVTAKLAALLAPCRIDPDRLWQLVIALPDALDAGALLGDLP